VTDTVETLTGAPASEFCRGWLRSFALADEETYVWMLTAADVDHVALVNQRAGVRYDHVVEVITAEPGGR
jgi:hypothetical protein